MRLTGLGRLYRYICSPAAAGGSPPRRESSPAVARSFPQPREYDFDDRTLFQQDMLDAAHKAFPEALAPRLDLIPPSGFGRRERVTLKGMADSTKLAPLDELVKSTRMPTLYRINAGFFNRGFSYIPFNSKISSDSVEYSEEYPCEIDIKTNINTRINSLIIAPLTGAWIKKFNRPGIFGFLIIFSESRPFDTADLVFATKIANQYAAAGINVTSIFV